MRLRSGLWRIRESRWSLRAALLAVAVVMAVAATALSIHSAVELANFERADTRRSTIIVAGGQRLEAGVHVGAVDLTGTLGRLGYAESRDTLSAPGQFRRGAGAWEIFLNGVAAAPAARVRLEIAGDRIRRVHRDGTLVASVTLEPEILTSAGDRAGEQHRPVRLADVPPALLAAFLAAEDQRFFEHRGVDLRGTARAAWVNVRQGRIAQGGSTITQQLVKNRLLTPRRTFLRKVREAWLATLVDWRYPKERILEGYLNEIYLGQRGGLAVRGVGAAARAYFGKEVGQLTVAESATLAGMTRAPNSYSPAVNPERARERRNAVLARMQELGWIGEQELRTSSAERVRVRPGPGGGQPAPYFTDAVRQELERELGEDALAEVPGATIETPLDLALQRFAERAVTRGLERLEARHPKLTRRAAGDRLQAALVVIDPATGQVKALVGGRDYGASQFNRATLARRQPGSAFKPFVYTAALARRPGTVSQPASAGSTPQGAPALTAASFVDDSPISLSVNGNVWAPRNYEDKYEGRVTVRRALEGSLNAATVHVAEAAGLPRVVDTARAFGIESPLAAVPAVVLGSFEVTPLELARAYAPFANGGTRPHGPVMLTAVRGADGTVLGLDDGSSDRVLSPAEAYLITSLLTGVVQNGTAASESGRLAGLPVAGKTGTTNDGRDAWFVGYTPTLLAAVWVGFDDGEAHGFSGAQAALPIWADFMRQALEAYPAAAFDMPPGVIVVDIDATNGKRATSSCPLVARETFLAGTEPAPCDEHGGLGDQFRDWWRRFQEWWRR